MTARHAVRYVWHEFEKKRRVRESSGLNRGTERGMDVVRWWSQLLFSVESWATLRSTMPREIQSTATVTSVRGDTPPGPFRENVHIHHPCIARKQTVTKNAERQQRFDT